MSEKPTLTQTEIIRAATNDPALSTASFKLGDREFPIVDLPYDDYITFLSLLQPLFESFATAITGQTLPNSESMTPASILRYCAKSLPEMVQIMCRQTSPDITVDEVKSLGRNPFVLAAAVLKQVEHNKIIEDISDFFGLIAPMINRAKI